MAARFRSALMPEVKAAEMEASVTATMTMDQVLAQCSSSQTQVARVVLRHTRPSNPCPGEGCKYGRRRALAPCRDEASDLTPLAILAAV
eukprot:124724-Pleurochrysis_carterae.AAC.1